MSSLTKAFNFTSSPKSLKLGLTGMLGSVALLVAGTTSAHAVGIKATLTADNHYGLYYGQVSDNELSLTLVGRNEKGTPGNPGVYNWSLPETFNFTTNDNDYLYVLAWDDGGPQSWIGQFTSTSGASLLSNTSNWQYKIGSGSNPGSSGNLPSILSVASDIYTGNWNQPQALAPQGSYPWGTIPGISSQAKFIWHDTLSSNSSSDNGYAIFRAKVPTTSAQVPTTSAQVATTSVPEPTTLGAIAVAGVMGWMIKRKQKPYQAE